MVDMKKLLSDVFSCKKGERILILYDEPVKEDTLDWEYRRNMAKVWHVGLSKDHKTILASYRATYANNAELPDFCMIGDEKRSFDELFSESDIVIALTEFSATAPLHQAAEKHGVRVASMPGFNEAMLPSLDVDYRKVREDVHKIYEILKKSDSAQVTLCRGKKEYVLNIDFRGMDALADDGDCSKKGKVINLPSGEAFISPNDAPDSGTSGSLPLIYDGEEAVYTVASNNIVSSDPETRLMKKIKKDPAIGNIAEFAFGVLGRYGLDPSGKTLLDEKLGMHIALGRNDHFGGNIGPLSFKSKEEVWHQDFVFIESMQEGISVKEAVLISGDKRTIIIKDDDYVI